jgi:hypothetical protein
MILNNERVRAEAVVGHFKAPSWRLSGGTDENHETPQDSPGRGSNEAPPKCKSEGLPLEPTCSVRQLDVCD